MHIYVVCVHVCKRGGRDMKGGTKSCVCLELLNVCWYIQYSGPVVEPTSTKAPKSVIFRTIPCSSTPSYMSSNVMRRTLSYFFNFNQNSRITSLGTDVKKEKEVMGTKRRNSYECVRLGIHLPFAIFFSPLFMAKRAAFLSILGCRIEFART